MGLRCLAVARSGIGAWACPGRSGTLGEALATRDLFNRIFTLRLLRHRLRMTLLLNYAL